MKKEKFDLKQALYDVLADAQDKKTIEERAKVFLIIADNTGIQWRELNEIIVDKVKNGETTVNKLYYSILGCMAERKLDASHII